MHWDHTAGMETFPQAFPEAVFYAQKQEYDFWINNPIAKKKVFAGSGDSISNKVLQEMEGTNRLRRISGDEKIGPGLELLLTPGHTPALQSLAANTKKGTAIVASDCVHIKKVLKKTGRAH